MIGIPEAPSPSPSDFECFQRSDLTMPGWSVTHEMNDRPNGRSLSVVFRRGGTQWAVGMPT